MLAQRVGQSVLHFSCIYLPPFGEYPAQSSELRQLFVAGIELDSTVPLQLIAWLYSIIDSTSN